MPLFISTMRVYFVSLIRFFRFNIFVWMLLLVSGWSAFAQKSPVWNRSALKDSVTALLANYQSLHNQLIGGAGSSVEREFVHLFSNPKVQIVSGLDQQYPDVKVSVEEYLVQVGELFPDGLTVIFDFGHIILDQPTYDRNNRYLIHVLIKRTLSGSIGDKPFSSTAKVEFEIGFFNADSPGNFAIYGMHLPPGKDKLLSLSFSPSLSGFSNTAMASDARLDLRSGTGYTIGASYTVYFSDHWGLGTGVQFSQYSGNVSFDHFDPLGGFSPSMRDIVVENDLWFFEIPLYFSYRTIPSRRWVFSTDFGVSGGLRTFEDMRSSASNTNTGQSMQNVISDAGWIGEMNRFNVNLHISAKAICRLTNRLNISGGFGLQQGVSGLDNYTRLDFVSSRYLGQFNPLWAAPGKTVSRSFQVNIGLAVLLSKVNLNVEK